MSYTNSSPSFHSEDIYSIEYTFYYTCQSLIWWQDIVFSGFIFNRLRLVKIIKYLTISCSTHVNYCTVIDYIVIRNSYFDCAMMILWMHAFYIISG